MIIDQCQSINKKSVQYIPRKARFFFGTTMGNNQFAFEAERTVSLCLATATLAINVNRRAKKRLKDKYVPEWPS
jgi:hypothetical protein